MFFPYSCDARLYHLPIATGTLIFFNVAIFIGAVAGAIDPENGWILEYGHGVHPIEWVTSIFMHGNLEHLLGNMFFLWSFGLVVEGKLGWLRFLAIYFGIGVGQSALEQCVMGFSSREGASFGASAAISGLMAMVCIWAPANSLSVFYWLMTPNTAEIAVGLFAGIFIGLDILSSVLLGMGALGSIWHLAGVAMGAVGGVALLKSGAVDCEDWDLFSVLKGEAGAEKKKKRLAAEEAPDKVAERTAQRLLTAQRKFDAYLEINQAEQALAVRRRMIDQRTPLDLSRDRLMKLIVGLHKQSRWKESAPVMAEVLERFPEGSQAVRLKLAQICLVELEKPNRALELVRVLDGAPLADAQEALKRKLVAAAKKQIAEGAIEVDDGAW